MTFQKAYDQHILGNKIRRKGWENPRYYYGLNRCYECGEDLHIEDIFATDWEVMK